MDSLCLRPPRATATATAAGGLLCIIAGDFVYALYERVLHGPAPFPSLADATTVASGFGLLSWTFLMAPTATSNQLGWLGRLVALDWHDEHPVGGAGRPVSCYPRDSTGSRLTS
jgi:hypothetical protein